MPREPYRVSPDRAAQTEANRDEVRVKTAVQVHPDDTTQPGVAILQGGRLVLMLDLATAARVARDISDRALDHKLRGVVIR